MKNSIVRAALEKDAKQIFILASTLATSFKIEESKFKKVFSSMLVQDHVFLAVVEQKEIILGYVLAGSRPFFYASGEVAWVEEKCRGQALGRKLMEAAEDWAKQRNCKLISLATRRAAPFYLALGYDDSATYFKKHLDYDN